MLDWIVALTLCGAVARDQLSTAPEAAVRAAVSRALELELDAAADAKLPAGERLSKLRFAVAEAARELGARSRVGRALAQAAEQGGGDVEPVAALARLAQLTRERALDLEFSPRIESPRPEGFPQATPVGEIEVLDYPAYRLARVEMRRGLFGGQNSAFWKLFRHIESRSISMTAPVELTYAKDGGAERMASMAFLYASPSIGAPGRSGEIEVVDVPAARVVSLGLRGGAGERVFERARADLRAWLAEHPEWVEAGPARVMGWNSPMVRDAERFHEVQIPIRALQPQESARPGPAGAESD